MKFDRLVPLGTADQTVAADRATRPTTPAIGAAASSTTSTTDGAEGWPGEGGVATGGSKTPVATPPHARPEARVAVPARPVGEPADPTSGLSAALTSGLCAAPTPPLAELGFKAARLATLLGAGLPVLPGWVVPVGEGKSAMGAGVDAIRANGMAAGRVAVLAQAARSRARGGTAGRGGWAGGAGDCAVFQSAGRGWGVGGGVFLGDGGWAGRGGLGGEELLGFGVCGGSAAAGGGVRGAVGGAGTGRAGAAGDRA